MKTIKKLFLVVTILFISISCAVGDGVEGNQKVINKKREISTDFTGIEVSQGINVYLTQSSNYSLEIELDENLHDLLITEVKDNILKIYFSEKVGRRRRSIVHLSMPLITKLISSNDAEIISQNTLTVQDLIITSFNSAEIELDLIANKIQCNASKESKVNLKGTANYLIAKSISDSDINAENLISQKVEATASNGSDIEVQVVISLIANASSGADIKYLGNPTELKIEKLSGAKVEKKEE